MRCAARQAQEVGLPTVGVVANYERGCSTVFEDRRLTCEMLWGSAHKVTKGRHFAMPLTPSFVDPELLSFMFAPCNRDLFFTSTLAQFHTAQMVRDTDKRSYGLEAPFSFIGYSEQLH